MNYMFLFSVLGGLLIGCGKDNPNNSTTIPVVGNWVVSRNNEFIERNHFYSNGLGQRHSINVGVFIGAVEDFEGDFRWDYSGATGSYLPRFSVVFIESGRAELYEIEFAGDDLFVAYLLKPSGERATFKATYRRIRDNQRASDVISVN